MALFEVQFEDVGFGTEETSGEMDAKEIGKLTEPPDNAVTFPHNVRSLLEASYSADDSVYKDGIDPDGDTKVFISITLLIEAKDIEAARQIPIPTDLLTSIAETMTGGVDLEGNWEIMNYSIQA